MTPSAPQRRCELSVLNLLLHTALGFEQSRDSLSPRCPDEADMLQSTYETELTLMTNPSRTGVTYRDVYSRLPHP